MKDKTHLRNIAKAALLRAFLLQFFLKIERFFQSLLRLSNVYMRGGHSRRGAALKNAQDEN